MTDSLQLITEDFLHPRNAIERAFIPSVIANLKLCSRLLGNFSIVSHLTWCFMPPTFNITVSLLNRCFTVYYFNIKKFPEHKLTSTSHDWLLKCRKINTLNLIFTTLLLGDSTIKLLRLSRSSSSLILWCFITFVSWIPCTISEDIFYQARPHRNQVKTGTFIVCRMFWSKTFMSSYFKLSLHDYDSVQCRAMNDIS